MVTGEQGGGGAPGGAADVRRLQGSHHGLLRSQEVDAVLSTKDTSSLIWQHILNSQNNIPDVRRNLIPNYIRHLLSLLIYVIVILF